MEAGNMPRLSIGIGEMSRRTGCKIETIRYYERSGLMPDPPRKSSGHRVYGEGHVKRLGFIRRGRELGFSMSQIKGLLSLVDTQRQSCSKVAAQVEPHLRSVRQRIEDLKRLETTLADTLSRCDRGDQPECPILESLHSGYYDF